MEGKEGKEKTELNLSGKGLEELPKEVVDKFGADIKKIDLTENKIKTGTNFDGLKKLEVLVLDKNEFQEFKNWPSMPTVHTLWLNNNKVSEISTFMDSIVTSFPNLTYLSMLMNPAVPNIYFSDGEFEAYMRYRYYVIYRLKKLAFLDATPVTAEERQEAEKRGKFMKVAKPKSLGGAAAAAASSADEEKSSVAPRREEAIEHKPKVSSFLAKGKARYDGSNSEGNRFIMNDDL